MKEVLTMKKKLQCMFLAGTVMGLIQGWIYYYVDVACIWQFVICIALYLIGYTVAYAIIRRPSR